MNEYLIYLLVGIVCLIIGYFMGNYIQKLKTKSSQSSLLERQQQLSNNLEVLNQRLNSSEKLKTQLQSEKERLGNQIVRYEADMENLHLKNREQKQEVEKLQEKFTKEFENLANKILEEKSLKFTERNEKNIKNILTPLNEKIQLFEKKVEESQKENISIHSALKEQLLNLQTQNLKITQEAENLTKALKGDSKMQGNWGELVLERVLEKSGLEKEREYTVQKSFTLEDGSRVLPDVIINLPDGKKMIVDSKVSLTDYERFVNSEDSDFVLLFIPIEPAFAIAINNDNSLYNKAFEQNIVIVTPSTLLATLRTIDSMWNNEKQQRNAIEIARQAGALYDKFEGFVNDLTKVGKKMDDAKDEYKGAMNKLVEGRGNIIISIEKLKKMGAKAKKSIPEPILKRAQEDDFEEPKLKI